MGHECAQPLGVQEVELTQLALHIVVVQQHATVMEEADSLQGGGGGGGDW